MNKFNMPALFICASFFSTQCSTQAPPAILGKIELAGSGIKPMVYLIQPRNFNDIACSYLGLVLDSAQIDANGKFAFFRTVKSETLLELCVQQLLNDDYVSFLPARLVSAELRSGVLVAIPVRQPKPRSWHCLLVMRADSKPGPTAAEFIETVRSAAKNLPRL